jgi:hypothetical protein
MVGETDTVPLDMVTVAVATGLLPPGPMHTREYEVVAVSGPVLNCPLVVFVPVHPAAPDAVHPVALVELHDSTEGLPLGTAGGAAVNNAVGMMLTVVLAAVLVPPGPVQVSEYMAEVDIAPVL